jgi:hypothetical protein
MRSFLAFVLLLVSVEFAAGQIRTEETRTTTDSTSGKTMTTSSVIVSKSEDITPRNSMIVVNPLKFFLFYNLSYFQKVGDRIGIGGGIQIPVFDEIGGFGGNLELRYYPSGKTLRGVYVAPNISVSSLSALRSTGTVTTIGVLLGWQWFPGDDFALGLGIGIDRYILSRDGDYDFSSYSGTAPAIRFDIGYAW